MGAMDTSRIAGKPAYAELARLQQRLYRLDHLGSIAFWDRNTMMPPKGNEARAAAEAELETVMHALVTDPRQKGLLAAAEAEPLDEV